MIKKKSMYNEYISNLKSWISKLDERYILLIPYLWIILFLLFPFIILIKISFSNTVFGVPPFGPIIEYMEGQVLHIQLFFTNYIFLFTEPLYIRIYLDSILMAFISTCIAIIIAYPFAYAIYKTPEKIQIFLILLVVLPFYTSFLFRVYAWVGLLGYNGPLNTLLLWAGIINTPLKLLYTKFAVMLGMIYCYLPFVIIPLYLSLQKMNTEYIEAAYDLGCSPLKTFFKITLPMTKNGLISGFILMFIPSIGEFVIPEILGGSNTLFIGRVVWNEFFHHQDWPLASTIAVVMFICIIVPLSYLKKMNPPYVRDNHE